jgi:hypothetical protein
MAPKEIALDALGNATATDKMRDFPGTPQRTPQRGTPAR